MVHVNTEPAFVSENLCHHDNQIDDYIDVSLMIIAEILRNTAIKLTTRMMQINSIDSTNEKCVGCLEFLVASAGSWKTIR